ncbi:MAG: C25 family cysteine peptidase, partial [Candidatus Promineifilaceae bacterium]
MGHANQTKNPLLFTIAFALVFLFVLPLQARAKQNDQDVPSEAQSGRITLLHSDESGISFELLPPNFTRTTVETEKGSYDQIQIPGYGNIGLAGHPDLPQKGFLIALPPGAVPSLKVVSAENHQETGGKVAPLVQKTLLNNNYEDFTSADYVPDFETSYPFDEELYSQDANFPAAPVSLGKETVLRHQRAVWVIVNPILVNPAQETLTVFDRLQIEVSFEFPNGRPDVETLQPETGAYAEILQANFLNYEQSLNWRTRSEPETSVLSETSPCMDANAFRIAVKQTGMYTISHANLTAAYSSFPASVPSAKIRMCYNDQEIRIKVNDGGDNNFNNGDTLNFYGESIKTQETDTNIYWLTYSTSGANGLRMAAATNSGSGTAPTYYIPNYHLETDSKYYSSIPKADLNDHWYWQAPIVAEPNNPNVDNHLDVTFQMTNKATGTYNFTFRADLWGFTQSELHKFEVRLNGVLVGTGQFTGSGLNNAHYLYEGNAPSSALTNGTNTLTITAVDTDGDPNNTGQRFLVDWVEIEPWRQFIAQNNRLAFGQDTAGTYTFATSGFTNGAIVNVFDVTDGYNPTVKSETADGSGNVSFNRTIAAASKYELSTTSAYLSPNAITKDTIGSGILGTPSNTADLIIITVPSFDSALTPLRSLRTSQGLTVKTVYVQDIFDEFSYGRYATYGIHDFLEYAYDNWSGDRDYVLLAGDASYDHRNVLGNNGNSNQVPVYLRSGVDSTLGEAAADNQYVVFDSGSNLAQMMLGRLPAQTPAELTAMIDKIIAYETVGSSASWRWNH